SEERAECQRGTTAEPTAVGFTHHRIMPVGRVRGNASSCVVPPIGTSGAMPHLDICARSGTVRRSCPRAMTVVVGGFAGGLDLLGRRVRGAGVGACDGGRAWRGGAE